MSDYPEQLRLDNQLCFLLYSTSRSMTRLYRPFLKELGLTYPQYLVMLVLWECDENEITVGDLGERLRLDSGTLTPLLKRLEQSGLLLRTRCQEDERVVLIALSEEGRRLRSKAEHVPSKLLCQLGISDGMLSDRVGLMTSLHKLNHLLSDASQ
jgi:DNA-binding MarR family transcriptional regulator